VQGPGGIDVQGSGGIDVQGSGGIDVQGLGIDVQGPSGMDVQVRHRIVGSGRHDVSRHGRGHVQERWVVYGRAV
jgi:hypothetical protein